MSGLWKSLREKHEKWVMENIPNIGDISDLLGRDKSGKVNKGSPLFFVMSKLFGKQLASKIDIVSNDAIKLRQKYAYRFFRALSPLYLNGKKLIKEKIEELPKDRPIIYAVNHGFIEDVMSTIVMSERHAFFLFGSLPNFFNTINGLAFYLYGAILVNRRNKESRNSSVDKAVSLLKRGGNLIIYPEGVWNKTPEKLTLNFWPGVVKIAQQSNAMIVPIVHLPVKKKIYSSRLAALDVSKYGDMQTALEKLRDDMNTEIYHLIEKYSFVSRDELKEKYSKLSDCWENLLKKALTKSENITIIRWKLPEIIKSVMW